MNEDELASNSPVRERAVQNLLKGNLSDYLKRNLKVIGTEYFLGDVGRIDILAEDDMQNLVVIELKVVTPTREVIGQILSYMGAIRAEFPSKRVEGIIIAPEFDSPTLSAASATSGITLLRLEISWSAKILDLEGSELTQEISDQTRPAWHWKFDVPNRTLKSPDGSIVSIQETNIVEQKGIKVLGAIIPFEQIVLLGDGYQVGLFRSRWKVPSKR